MGFFSALTLSIDCANCETLELLTNSKMEFNSSSDLITIPLFLLGVPLELSGLISIFIDAGLPRYSGSLNKKTPAKLVGFLSQSLPSFRNCDSLSSPDIYAINNYFIHYPFNFIYLLIN